MALPSSKKVIYAALAGNSLIAVTKFFAAAMTGSAAMLSEAIHSVVDTGNQVLMLYGLKKAAQPADDEHPFGYGMELYFWTFVVAILIFGLGAGISVYQGVDKILYPHPINDPYINYIVLVMAMVFEGWAWSVAFVEFRRVKGDLPYWQAIRASKDPTVFTVLFEDTAAMLGLIVALVGIYLSEHLNMPVLDGVASIGIGIILAVIATFLAYECKGLLIGERASRQVLDGLSEIIDKQPGILRMNEMLTMHLSPQDILLNLSIDFKDQLSSQEVEREVSEMEREIKVKFPEIKRVFIEAQSWRGHQQDQDNC
ncbi:MAG: cation diffusion facilitator family transporter [Rhodospirillales bacterium]|jgi:cation diffusion facilitator family transporter